LNRKSNFTDFEIKIDFMIEPKIIHNRFYDMTEYYIESTFKSCLFIELKIYLSPLTSILDFKCKIRLGNLEFRRISRDFHFFKNPHHFLTTLKSLLGGNSKDLFFLSLFFYETVMYFLHFEVFVMEENPIFAQGVFVMSC